jgi:hypothetical protein
MVEIAVKRPTPVAKADKSLLAKVSHEVDLYAPGALDGICYSILDDEQQRYVALFVSDNKQEYPDVIVMARVDGDKIIIEHDSTDKPLVDALMVNAGIPREQIILAYAGETLSEKSETS